MRNPMMSSDRWTRVLLTCTISFIITCCLPRAIQAYRQDFPFQPGEKLKFVIKWGPIPAGKAELEVLPLQTPSGVQAYHFVLTAKSNSFVDIFYKVRDRIDAYANLDMSRTIFYTKKQREGRRSRNVVVKFDWKNNQAQYSNFGEKEEPITLKPGSFDPLSAFYHARLNDFKENSEISVPVTDGKKNVIGRVKIVGREKVKLSSGTYDTYLLEPELKDIGGVFEKSKDAKIQVWITADERKIPVKIRSKVVVGSFVGELVSAEGID
jgi:hypothetical protein